MERNTDNKVLESINDNNLIFISAQPDTTYFHWQVSLYLYQFAKHGIIARCYALFGYTGKSPSAYVMKLASKYPTVIYYKDTRTNNIYSPTIRPHLLAKFFKDNPHLGRNVFYHDSDIFLTKLPRFDLMLDTGNTGYVSDTISYIGYNYLKLCSNRYKEKYNKLRDLDIFYGMCDVMQIDPKIVIENQDNSGGAQYILKNIDYSFWNECEKKCNLLYDYLVKYEKQYPIAHHIQKWTTDMWVVLWTYWKLGYRTAIHRELDFSWATGTVNDYHRLNIFHLAGITDANCSDKFYKGMYTKQTVFDAFNANPRIFDNIDKNNATYEYTNVIREYMKNMYNVERNAIENTNVYRIIGVKKFEISGHKLFNNTYQIDDRLCCDKPIWKSIDKKYIIFWSGKSWILTDGKYINMVGPLCGGYASSQSTYPYDNKWNIEIVVKII